MGSDHHHMDNNQQVPSNSIYYEKDEYKTTCLGRNCKNVVIHSLKLAIFKEYGYFCSTCKKSLEESDLVISKVTIHLGIGQGDFVKLDTYEKKIIQEKRSRSK